MTAVAQPRAALRALALLPLLAGCAATPASPPPPAPDEGRISEVRLHQVLNARDFTYAISLTAAPLAVAYSRLGMKAYGLAIWAGEPEAALLADVTVNPHEHDVEAVEFSPDGLRV
ncbi:MAG: hypothetical protein ACK4N5_14340, partial [Myxococcales bacterium]